MALSSDADARAFAETRKALLDALDRTQQEAADQAAELVRRGERRAHEIIVESDQCAALLEEQLTYLTEQLEHVRVRMTEIRARLARESKSEKNIILGPPPAQPRPAPPAPAPPAAQLAPPMPMAAPSAAAQLTASPQPATNDVDAQWRRPPASTEQTAFPPDPSQPAPAASGTDSLHETLRTLRSALESLSGQSPQSGGD